MSICNEKWGNWNRGAHGGARCGCTSLTATQMACLARLPLGHLGHGGVSLRFCTSSKPPYTTTTFLIANCLTEARYHTFPHPYKQYRHQSRTRIQPTCQQPVHPAIPTLAACHQCDLSQLPRPRNHAQTPTSSNTPCSSPSSKTPHNFHPHSYTDPILHKGA